MPAGERKIPDPIVIPTTSATELQRPSVRGSFSAGVGGVVVMAVGRGPMAIAQDYRSAMAPSAKGVGNRFLSRRLFHRGSGIVFRLRLENRGIDRKCVV